MFPSTMFRVLWAGNILITISLKKCALWHTWHNNLPEGGWGTIKLGFSVFVTRRLDYFWALATIKISPMMYQICQSGLKNFPSKKKLSKICQRLAKFSQSGEFSPNLVLLFSDLSSESDSDSSSPLMAWWRSSMRFKANLRSFLARTASDSESS